MFVGGPPKSYKSFAMNTLAYHLSTGTNVFGASRKKQRSELPILNVQRPYRVLFLEQEIGDFSLKDRLKPIADSAREEHRTSFYDNLFTHSCDRNLRLDEKRGCELIRDMCMESRAEVLLLDPFVEFHHGDENSQYQMSAVMRGVDFIKDSLKQHKQDIAFIISHHAGKGMMSGADNLRGSSAIFGKGDSYLMLSVHNRAAGFISVNPTIRRGPPLRNFIIRLDWQSLTFKFHGWATNKLMLETLKEDPVVTDEWQ